MRASAPILVLACLLLTTDQGVAVQGLPGSLPKAAGDVESVIFVEYSPADLVDLVRESNLIARVLVLSGRSRLSSDNSSIETDCALQLLETYVANEAALASPTIVVTRPGGQLTIDGRSVKAYETDFPSFEPSEEYVLFLRRGSDGTSCVIPYGGQGAFREAGGFSEQVSEKNGKFREERGRVSSLAFRRDSRVGQEVVATEIERRSAFSS